MNEFESSLSPPIKLHDSPSHFFLLLFQAGKVQTLVNTFPPPTPSPSRSPTTTQRQEITVSFETIIPSSSCREKKASRDNMSNLMVAQNSPVGTEVGCSFHDSLGLCSDLDNISQSLLLSFFASKSSIMSIKEKNKAVHQDLICIYSIPCLC